MVIVFSESLDSIFNAISKNPYALIALLSMIVGKYPISPYLL